MEAPDDRHQHRQRLRARFLRGGATALDDHELLELLLFAAIPRRDTKPVAKRLLKAFGGFAEVLNADPDALMRVQGIGEASATAIKAAQAAALRMMRTEMTNRPVLGSWDRVLDYCHATLAHERIERLHLLFLDSRNRLIADEAHQRGTINHTPVYPREVAKRALELGAAAVILVHNHPSGDPTPSQADIDMTKEVVSAVSALGIIVHDHIVVGREGYASFRSLGLL